MSGNRRKIKLKNPANLLSAVAVLIMSIILSLVIHQNFFLVFLSAFLVYVAAYVFFEKRRLQRFTAEDDVEAENEYAEQEDAPAKKRHWSASRSSSFDIMKTAKFKDSAVEEPTTTAVEESFVEEVEEEEDSWRSMYSQLSESDDSSFEEEYKRYFSTTLPDREEIAKAQQPQAGSKTNRDVYRREEVQKPISNNDVFDAENFSGVEETPAIESDSSEESEEDDEEGHIVEVEDLETETLEIQNRVDDLISHKEPEDAVLAKSITAKLKFFRKTRKKIEVEEFYDQDETMSSGLELIDSLYSDDTDIVEAPFVEEVVNEVSEESPEEILEEEMVEEAIAEEPVLEDLQPEEPKIPEEDVESIQSDDVPISEKLISTLKKADVEASIKEVIIGASVIRYEIRPRSMSKLNRIAKLENTLEEALNVGPVRVVDVGSNRSLAGIEIPKPQRTPVSFHNCITSSTFQMNHSNTSCVLGQDVHGEVVLADLKNLSHLLIVGKDPVEKNMCMHALVSSILSKVGVFHVDFLMIDISNREFNLYEPIPHMYGPVLNFADDALAELEALEKTIDTRLELFQRNNARDLVSYNATKQESPLSRIIVFINELGDLMEHDAKRTESLLCNILQKARSTGIHVVLGTTHPSEDVLTGLIKANITSKVCFALESAEESEEILGMTGAEKLLGDGDMLYYPKGYLAPKRLQGTNLEKEEIQNLIESIL